MFERCKKTLSVLITCVLVSMLSVPTVAFAASSEMQIENHTRADGASTISNVRIDDVDEPEAGKPLDDKAMVTADPNASWEIPVLWVSDSLELAAEAEEGRTYLPSLAFYVPEDYAMEGDAYEVALSESLTKLFGSQEVISVYDASTGITYILPASLRDFFFPQQGRDSLDQPEFSESQAASGQENNSEQKHNRSLADIYCAQTARDVLSDEDLEYLIDLILNKLQPQAVELLLDGFPALREAADQDEIGREIGLYIYYKCGDKDGLAEHEQTPSGALAYVYATPVVDGDNVKYCYMIGINTESLVKLDDDGNPVQDSATGKFVLLRDDETIATLGNTLVHETLHALMHDYNRTGMAGAKDLRDVLTNEVGDFASDELEERYNTIHFPQWFIEGIASTVENVYQFRSDDFKSLRAEAYGRTYTDFFTEGLLDNYLNGARDGEFLYYDLRFARGFDDDGNELDLDDLNASRYVSGYLACLYLGELSARSDDSLGSSVTRDGDVVSISNENIRMGLNNILERLHNGETLDQVIYDISPLDEIGNKRYTSTAEFEQKFIKGVALVEEPDTLVYLGDGGDDGSYTFVITYLNYLVAIDNTFAQNEEPNGSILLDINTERKTPLDSDKDSFSDYLQIVESSELVESTVPNDIALAGGGKSEPDMAIVASAASESELQVVEDAAAVADDEVDVAVDEAVAEVTDIQFDLVEPVVAESADVAPVEPESVSDPVVETEVIDAAA